MRAGSSPPRWSRVRDPFLRFFRIEASGGIVLLVTAAVALAWSNSPWAEGYFALWERRFGFEVAGVALRKDLLHWINDGLMAVFFFLVGLEIKREVRGGELARPRQAALPIAGAIGGVLVPVVLYLAFNAGTDAAVGWGIPMATDIAFALGALALFGSRVPIGLTVFLTALAIVDDLAAVVVIALFYTASISGPALAAAAVLFVAMAVAAWLGVRRAWVYVLLSVGLWVAFVQSGLHATIAGVLAAITIPHGPERSLLERIEHVLEPWVAYGVLPLFALANAGVALSGAGVGLLGDPVVLGVTLGLVVGKQVGVTAAAWLAVRLGLAVLPHRVRWGHVYGAAWLCGIGFTMSLFIASLSFGSDPTLGTAKAGILGASLVAGIGGLAVLGWTLRRSPADQPPSAE